MNILIFSIEFPPHGGGAGSYSRNLAVGLSKMNHSVTILTIHKKEFGDREKVIDENLKRYKNLTLIRKPFIPKLYILTIGKYCDKLLQNNNYDILFLADAGAQKIAAYTLKKNIVPSWTVFHGSEIKNYFMNKSMLFNIFQGSTKLKIFFKKVNGCIAVSHDMRVHVLQELPELSKKVHVIHHGIDMALFIRGNPKEKAQARRLLGLSQKQHILFSASRLIQEKGQDVLIKAMPSILEYLTDVLLIIAGEGPYRDYLENLVKERALQRYIQFVNHLFVEEMIEYFHACDLFVMLSRRKHEESFGLVYLEANACGRAVVAGRTGGVAEAVEDGISGVLVDPMDIDSVANTIIALLKNDKQRKKMEKSAYERTVKYFTIEEMAKQTLNIIKSQMDKS